MAGNGTLINQPVVRGSIGLKRFRQGDTLTSLLKSKFPLVQYVYKNGGTFPDWSVTTDNYKNSPIVYPHIQSNLTSLPLNGSEIINPIWFYDGNEITPADSRFQIIAEYSGTKVPGLKIISNLMDGVTTNKTIRLECEAFTGGVSTPIFLTIDVQRQEISEIAYNGIIVAKNGGAITQDTPTEELTAILRKGGKNVEEPWKVEWWRVVSYDQVGGGTVGEIDPVTGDIIDGVDDGLRRMTKEGKTIILEANDIHLSDTIMAKFILIENGSEVAYATTLVIDITDPLMLKFTNDPATGIVEEKMGDGGVGRVRTHPRVCRKNSDEEFKINGRVAFTKFSFSIRNNGYQIRTQDYDNKDNIQYFDTLYTDFGKKTIIVEGTGEVNLQETDSLVLAVETQENWTE